MFPYVGSTFRLYSLSLLAALAVPCLLMPRFAHSQETETPLVTSGPVKSGSGVVKRPADKRPMAGEIAVTTMIPNGDYRLFGATVRCNAWTVGVEYDHPRWVRFMGSQWSWVAEVIPLFILSEPAKSDFWGNAQSPNQKLVPGVSISPVGFRTLWRGKKAVRPFVIGKLGAAVFTQKALSPNASYVNFNVQADLGLLIKVTDRLDLRVDPFVFFHVSNGYLAASNPGMDELATKIGISYHLGRREH